MFLVAATLLVAGAAKAFTLQGKPGELTFFKSRTIVLLWCVFEQAMAFLLLSKTWRKAAWRVSFALFGAFAVVAGIQLASGRASCGCFGTFTVPPLAAMILDLAVVGLLLLTRRHIMATSGEPVARRRPVAAAIAFFVVAAATCLFVLGHRPAQLLADGTIRGGNGYVVLEPADWVGKPCPLLKHVDIAGKISSGRWTVLLYHRDCPQCKELIESLNKKSATLADGGSFPAAAMIEVPQPDGKTAPQPPHDPSFLCGTLAANKRWFVETPLVMDLHDGKVLAVRKPKAGAGKTPAGMPDLATAPVFAGSARLGFIEPGATRLIGLKIANDGPRALAISKASADCPCLAMVNVPNTVPAGGSAVVHVMFTAPRERAGYSKAVAIATDDPARPNIVFPVVANVGLPLELTPSPLDLGVVIPGENRSLSLDLINHGDKPVRPSYCVTSVRGCTALVPRAVVAPGGKLPLPVTFTAPAAATGRQRITLEVHTDSDIQPVAAATIEFTASGDYSFSATRFAFGELAAGESAARTIELTTKATGKGDLVKSAVLAGLENATGAAAAECSGDKAIIRCNLTAGRSAGEIRGAVLVTIPGLPQPVRLLVSGVVKGR